MFKRLSTLIAAITLATVIAFAQTVPLPTGGGPATVNTSALETLVTAGNALLDEIVDALTASAAQDVAHDDPDIGNPVKIGYRAIAHGANPTAVAAGDRTNAYANRAGVPFMIGGHPNVITREWVFTDADNAQTNAALITVSAGTVIVATQAQWMCANTNTGDVAMRLGFAAATLPSVSASTGAAGILLSVPVFDANTGASRGTGAGILGAGADGEDLRITSDDPAGGSCRLIVSYYTIES